MKQKVTIQVPMKSQKSRSKAMKIAVGFAGVESLAVQGLEKNQIEVTGEGIDVVLLTKSLRKNFGSAELLSVAPVGEKKEEPVKKVEAPAVVPVDWSSYYYSTAVPSYFQTYVDPREIQWRSFFN